LSYEVAPGHGEPGGPPHLQSPTMATSSRSATYVAPRNSDTFRR
jgi:hypothetical protein